MKYRLQPSPDLELKTQIKESKPYFQGEDFERFLREYHRFDESPCYVAKEGQEVMDALNNEPTYHYGLRAILKEIPLYMQTAEQLGLNYKQRFGLLMHLFKGDKYAVDPKISDMIILTKALRASQWDKDLVSSIPKVKKLMSAGVGGSGMDGTLYGLYIASRLGVPVAQASSMIAKGAEGSYVIGPFNEALKSMLPSKPNPELVVKAFEILNDGGRNYWFAGGYKPFEQAMTFAAPENGISVNDMLAIFVSASKSKSKQKALEGAIEKKGVTLSKEEYFLPFEGELEPFAQPYATRRSLGDGVNDLVAIANASYNDWKEITEGMFIFDPENELWYSLGGKLETPSIEQVLSGRVERVRHHFLPYDISALSETPFLFHVHPKVLDCFVTPPRDSLTHPHLKDHLTKFLTATPSRADYKVVAELMKEAKGEVFPRSFIAHALGVTEFVYPNDIKAIEEMAEKSRDLRDETMLNVNPDPNLLNVTKTEFVRALLEDLNSRLPKGFALNLDPIKN